MPRSASLETRAAGGHNINFPNLSIWPSSGVGLLSTQAPKLEQYLTTNGGRWALGSGCFQQVVMESAPKAYAWAAHCSHARAQRRLKPGALSGTLLALMHWVHAGIWHAGICKSIPYGTVCDGCGPHPLLSPL